MASHFLEVLFVKKLREKIEFCIDYKRLNAIIKKDCYLILLIKETLAQFKNAKYFIKINIRQNFYWIKMFKDLEKLIIFLTRFDIFKYLVMPFDLYNELAFWYLLIIYYLIFYIVLYKHILIIFLSIIRYYKIIILMFTKFYNIYKMLNYKLILINANFIYKKQIFLILLSLLKIFK